jgi:hypothetical protein
MLKRGHKDGECCYESGKCFRSLSDAVLVHEINIEGFTWSGVVVAQNLKEQQGSERERTKRVKFTKRSLVKWSPLNDAEESLVCIFFFKKNLVLTKIHQICIE